MRYDKMNICRICFNNNTNKLSIYETEQGISYFFMLNSVANIKVMKKTYEYICSDCGKRLKELYDFKLLIERSELELNQCFNIFRFNNINEIKPTICKFKVKPKILNIRYKKLINNACYNNTSIKRIVLDIAESNDSDVDKDHCNDFGTSDCYNREKYDKKEKQSPSVKKQCNVCIKPVYLKDVGIIKTYRNRSKTTDKRKQLYKEGICPYCGKFMKILSSHLLLHTAEKKFKCNECSRSFYKKKDLEGHIKLHFTEPTFKCDNCIAIFKTKATLARHMQIHMNVRDFKCEICSKAFIWKSGLIRHKQIHSFSRGYKCDICSMSFANKYSFQHHTRVHTGERPYKCELCSRPYSYKRDFNKHCLKKHGIVIDRRPVRVMDELILQKEKALMRNLMLKVHGVPTESDPRDSFQGPNGAQAFIKTLKYLQTCPLQMDIHI